MRPENFFRPDILAASAYHVPDATGFIKLDAMENPYDWPPEMVEAWLDHLRRAHPNRYPDPQAPTLKQALRRYARVPEGMAILLGNGSDEIIQILLMALVGREHATVLAPQPTFVMYQEIARWLNLDFVGVPLQADFGLDGAAMREAIARHRPEVVFLAYPNNPTGNLFDAALMEEIIRHAPGLVVVDEAYAPFAQATFMDRLERFDNLLVMRTLSKLGLAGLRLGFLVGRPDWLAHFDKLRLPYNINVLTQLSAEFALGHADVFAAQTAAIRVERDRLFQALSRLPGVKAFPSAANFILLQVPGADQVFEALKRRGILVKNLSSAGGLLRDCLRVTVGTPEENRAFLDALRAVLEDDE
ncbi:histidinol-phosphate aminotransferase [Methylomarinovum caldicuralii]|uniref:Histidinol-phosphate aminotransferase n=1 Tax=Methylomarinovum caldicuralii TaxID=438856 RepID=A0AAU9BSF8_9GAMM|nr:histidinol-phosphate transaminase [Methylomarinovum caldicuralii]BCX81476.1 histidinol-phosphate aminotransferase [Methylomarinovum caldicuralii]